MSTWVSAPGGLLSVTFAITPAVFATLNVITKTWTSAPLPAGAVLDSFREFSDPDGTTGDINITLGPTGALTLLSNAVSWQGGDADGYAYGSANRVPVNGGAVVLTLDSVGGVTPLSTQGPSLGIEIVVYYTIPRNTQKLP